MRAGEDLDVVGHDGFAFRFAFRRRQVCAARAAIHDDAARIGANGVDVGNRNALSFEFSKHARLVCDDLRAGGEFGALLVAFAPPVVCCLAGGIRAIMRSRRLEAFAGEFGAILSRQSEDGE